MDPAPHRGAGGFGDAGAGDDEAHIDPTALAVLATTAGGGLGSPGIEPGPRPWTPAAAMEPVLPSAPPPARPGEGVALPASPRPASGGQRARSALRVGVVLVALAVIVALVLLLGR